MENKDQEKENSIHVNQCLFNQNYWNRTSHPVMSMTAIRVTVRKLGNEVFYYLETNAAKSISQVTTLKVQTLKVSNKFEGG